MNIYVSGINYKSATVEIREKLGFTETEQLNVLFRLLIDPVILEGVLLCTCNRTEIYVVARDGNFDCRELQLLLCSAKSLNPGEYGRYFNSFEGTGAVEHLFRVACGLDSQVLGEDQILGQVNAAHEKAMNAGASGAVLNTLFRSAVTAAKRVKTSTGLSQNSLSVGSLAVKLMTENFDGSLERKNALIIGAGKIGGIVLEHLLAGGVERIYVTKRHHGSGNAEKFQEKHEKVTAVDYNERYRYAEVCDIVASSTSSPHCTITKEALAAVLNGGKRKVFVDLAVPRDMESSICELEGVCYFTMDDLMMTADENLKKRLLEAEKAEKILWDAVRKFEKWVGFREAVPVIREIRRFADGVVEERTASALAKLKNAGEEERSIVKASVSQAVNEVLNKLVYSIRETGTREDIQGYFRYLKELIS